MICSSNPLLSSEYFDFKFGVLSLIFTYKRMVFSHLKKKRQHREKQVRTATRNPTIDIRTYRNNIFQKGYSSIKNFSSLLFVFDFWVRVQVRLRSESLTSKPLFAALEKVHYLAFIYLFLFEL